MISITVWYSNVFITVYMRHTLDKSDLIKAARRRLSETSPRPDTSKASQTLLWLCMDPRIGAPDCRVFGDAHKRRVGRYGGSVAGAGRDILVVTAIDAPEIFAQGGTDIDFAVKIADNLAESSDPNAHEGCLDVALAKTKTYPRIADGDTTTKAIAEDLLNHKISKRAFSKFAGATSLALDQGRISDGATMLAGVRRGGVPVGRLEGAPIPGSGFVYNDSQQSFRPIHRHESHPSLYIADFGIVGNDLTVAAQRAISPHISPETVETFSALHHASLVQELEVPYYRID